MTAPKTDTTRHDELTPGQIRILDHFATIQAEMECLVRETRRTRDSILRTPGGHG
jgi:hypothetical protein